MSALSGGTALLKYRTLCRVVGLGASYTLQSIFSWCLFSHAVCCFSSFKYRKGSNELVVAQFIVTGLRAERP